MLIVTIKAKPHTFKRKNKGLFSLFSDQWTTIFPACCHMDGYPGIYLGPNDFPRHINNRHMSILVPRGRDFVSGFPLGDFQISSNPPGYRAEGF